MRVKPNLLGHYKTKMTKRKKTKKAKKNPTLGNFDS